MKKILIGFLITLVLPYISHASGGSVYSRFGIGDLYFSYDARRMSIGELGIALRDFDYLSSMNPAGWSALKFTRFETGVVYHGNNISSNNSSVYHSDLIIPGFMIGFPIYQKYGVSLVAGIVPYSNVDYKLSVVTDSSIVGGYTTDYEGKGGISKVMIGGTYQMPFGATLGASLDYYNGKISRTTSIEFTSGDGLIDGSFSDEYSYIAAGLTIGAISQDLSGLLGSDDISDLRLGAFYSNSVNVKVDSASNATTVIGTVTSSSGSVSEKIPARYGAGLSFIWNDDYRFIADYLHQSFGDFTHNNIRSDVMQDINKYSLGFEYRKSDVRSSSFWELVMLRFGLSYEESQYKINGKGINQISFYTGFSIPLDMANRLDFAFQYGRRGTKDNNLLLENIYRFSVSLSIGEIWFIRQDR
ncbi:hypothetical protein ACSSWA_03100 [Melioribacter sp. Ez-97]|uniref:hypothetical protein n=1 Tax=Melioribacter sp. Ez-97 TaxID=3423434 RepID=UPI003ED943D1